MSQELQLRTKLQTILDNPNPSPRDMGLPHDTWRSNQEGSIRYLSEMGDKGIVILQAPVGCHERGQGVLLYNGQIKRVEDIVVGDLLMGPDSQPKTVLELRRGYGQMFLVAPTKGKSFSVNADHVLTLVRTNIARRGDTIRSDCMDGEIVDVSVREWLGWSKSYKLNYKLFRVEVDFPKFSIPLVDPYFMGVLLGDGSLLGAINVTSMDREVIDEVYSQAELYSSRVRVDNQIGNSSSTFSIVTDRGQKNPLMDNLKNIGVFGHNAGNKFIPYTYKTASIDNRLSLLAGLMDTDGSLGSNYFDFISKSETLANDVAFVARSLGFSAYVKPCQKRDQNGRGGTYYRLGISGEVSSIPCKIPRKMAVPRRQKKDVRRTGLTISENGVGEYFGFVLDGDGRYLMDDFTVTHNSGKTSLAKSMALNGGVTSVVATKGLQVENYERGYEFDVLFGKANYPCVHPDRQSPEASASDCLYEKSMADCEYADECPYLLQKSRVIESDKRSINYSLMLSARWTRLSDYATQYIFYDEAHNLPDETLEFVSCTIKESDRIRWRLPEFPSVYDSSRNSINACLRWMEQSIGILSMKIAELKGDNDPYAKSVRSKAIRLRSKLSHTCEAVHLNQDDWFSRAGLRALSYDGNATPGLIVKPLTARHHFPGLFLGIYPRTVLMSATIGNHEDFCEELGIGDYEFYAVPNQFPPERRPVHILDVPSQGSKATESSRQKQADVISRSILDCPGDWSGIIHLTSWKGCWDLRKRLTKSGFPSGRLFIPQRGPTNTQIQEWNTVRDSKRGMIILSPSMHAGVDLLAERINICAKVPFGYFREGSWEWERMQFSNKFYRWQTAATLEQQMGRTRRGREEDYDSTWEKRGFVAVADGSFKKMGIQKSCSQDFSESLIWE